MKLKKDGTPKQSGGRRQNAGRPQLSPQHISPWPHQLERALRLAANNHFVLPREKFFTKREVRDLYGTRAQQEFSFWFLSIRRFDKHKADAIRQRQSRGLFVRPPASWPEGTRESYTAEKYADWLIDNKCFSWISVLKDEHKKDVWKRFGDCAAPA
jgi:hypothetical protein